MSHLCTSCDDEGPVSVKRMCRLSSIVHDAVLALGSERRMRPLDEADARINAAPAGLKVTFSCSKPSTITFCLKTPLIEQLGIWRF